MKNSFLAKAGYTLGIISLLLMILLFIRWQFLALSMDLPDVVWAKCLFKEQCAMPLSEYRTDLDWDKLCIENHQKTEDGVPCDYCNVVKLSKNDTQVYTHIIHLPSKEDSFIVHFTQDSTQCFSRNSTYFIANKDHPYGFIDYGVTFTSSPNP